MYLTGLLPDIDAEDGRRLHQTRIVRANGLGELLRRMDHAVVKHGTELPSWVEMREVAHACEGLPAAG